jgi:hypothetical protein
MLLLLNSLGLRQSFPLFNNLLTARHQTRSLDGSTKVLNKVPAALDQREIDSRLQSSGRIQKILVSETIFLSELKVYYGVEKQSHSGGLNVPRIQQF